MSVMWTKFNDLVHTIVIPLSGINTAYIISCTINKLLAAAQRLIYGATDCLFGDETG